MHEAQGSGKAQTVSVWEFRRSGLLIQEGFPEKETGKEGEV